MPNPEDSTNSTQTSDNQGGVVAISGFYFQMLALFADSIDSSVVQGTLVDNNSNEDGLRSGDALIGHEIRDDETLIGHEIHDADGVLINGRKVRIIQLKFSNNPNETLAPADIDDILRKMFDFADRHYPAPVWIREFVLLTTRKKSPAIENFETNRPNSLLGRTRRGQQTRTYDALLNHYDSLIWNIKSVEECWQTVEQWGYSFGMTGNRHRDEILTGVSRVFFHFMDVALNRNGWMTKGELTHAFTTYSEPRRLNPQETRAIVNEDVNKFIRNSRLGLATSIEIERQGRIEKIQEALTMYPIVVLEGKGGTGKSTLLAQIATQQAQIALSAGKEAADLRNPFWPCECIQHWRNCPDNPSELLHKALGRLPVEYFPHPVVIFSLDGVDEAEWNYGHLRDLVMEFNDLPSRFRSRAALLITCRNHKKRDYLEELAAQQENCIVIEVNRFEEWELSKKLENGQSALNQKICDALLSILEIKPFIVPTSIEYEPAHFHSIPEFNNYSPSRQATHSATVRTAEQTEVIFSLRHPLIWKQFCDLNDENIQRGILDNQQWAWNSLAGTVLDWFSRKCMLRTAIRNSNFRDEAERALLDVGRVCNSFESEYTKEQWELSGNERRFMREIFAEAVSCGLIDGDSSPRGSEKWNWRYAFFPRYLAEARST